MLLSTPTLTHEVRAHRRDTAECYLPADMRRFTRTEPVYSPTPLHDAVQAGDVDAVERALADGANPNAKTLFALTPLHIAARLYGLKRRQDRPAQRWAVIVELLLAAGADATAKDFQGSFPAKWCEGFQPPALLARMLELAKADRWASECATSARHAGRKWTSGRGVGLKVPLDRGEADGGISPHSSEGDSFGHEEEHDIPAGGWLADDAAAICEEDGGDTQDPSASFGVEADDGFTAG